MTCKIVGRESLSNLDQFDTVVLLVDKPETYASSLAALPAKFRTEIEQFAKKKSFKPKPGTHFSYETLQLKVTISCLPKGSSTFGLLEWARKQVGALTPGDRGSTLAIVSAGSERRTRKLLDVLPSALSTGKFELPSSKAKKPESEAAKDKGKVLKFSFCVESIQVDEAAQILNEALTIADGTNLVRQLAVLPGNQLTPTLYRKHVEQLVKQAGLKAEWISLSQLKKMGAGAFEAVAQGATDPNSGIFKIHYAPRKAQNRIALVGKGICFDTGGFNLKTGPHMYGMNDDMTGSAIALSLLLTLKRLGLPVSATAYLAITENVLSPGAFRPNDVVKALSGKTIEVVDTDAEGRMVLADTLTLAAKETPDLILDFATLTGACVRALGNLYSGAYSNQRKLFSKIRRAGRQSGERVWPLPNDMDYGRCLKSEVADIKQCRPSGGVDHIEAGYFLRQFVPRTVPWVHVDLSASSNEGGLGHIPSKTTGFGVRFGMDFIRAFIKSDSSSLHNPSPR